MPISFGLRRRAGLPPTIALSVGKEGEMHRKFNLESLLAVALTVALVGIVTVGCEETRDKLVDIEEGKLNAIEVSSAPTLDGDPSDPAWSTAPVLEVSLGDWPETDPSRSCSACHAFDSSVKVALRAVHTATDLYLLATWPDDDASFTRGAWVYSQATNEWNRIQGQSEDRIAFFFPIGQISGDDYKAGGCMIKCHTADNHSETEGLEDEVYLASGKADMWHLKAARTLPATSISGDGVTRDAVTLEVTGGSIVMSGWVDDKWVGQWDAANAPDGGRFADFGESAYSKNWIQDMSRPKYMEKEPLDFTDAMVLTQAEIDAGEAVGDPDTGVSDNDAAAYWPRYEALGAAVPERVLGTPSDSRADIVAAARWGGGTWTVEIRRPLRTGDDDDIQFAEGGEYTFGVAVMDNSGGRGHSTSPEQVLKLLR